MSIMSYLSWSSSAKAVVLMYHRVTSPLTDPWELAVNTNNFEEQIFTIRNQVIAVDQLLNQLKSGKLRPNSVCITFDDGYADNFINAAPLLRKYGCPATFFIASGFTGKKKLFWWDALAEIFLNTPDLPPLLDLEIGNKRLHYTLENSGMLTSDQFNVQRTWRWPDPAPTQRCEIYLLVWQILRDLNAENIEQAMKLLTAWSGLSQPQAAENLPMDSEQLNELLSDPLFQVGVHTSSHMALGAHDFNIQSFELTNCRHVLRENTTNYIDVVAYPYGNYNKTTLQVMKSEGFTAGFTTEEHSVTQRSDLLRLGRMKAPNVNGSVFTKQITKWLKQR